MKYNEAKGIAKKVLMSYETKIAKLEVRLDLEREETERLRAQIGKSDDDRVKLLEQQLRTLREDHKIVHLRMVELEAEKALKELK